ncbi:NB-ARC domain-containing protein [Spirillospora sp. NPDC048911]|uniref:NB-ARC domain-containing protein n=1 Tax=Spirillospora sp. NPDC048911 TaxID=3364527 RepID=UPI00371CD199
MAWVQVVVAVCSAVITVTGWALASRSQRDSAGGPARLGSTSRHLVRPVELPPSSGYFLGRDAELAHLSQTLTKSLGLEAPSAVTISGPGGIGKTTLAVELARRLADRFPDGQLFAHLTRLRASPGDPDAIVTQALTDFVNALQSQDKTVPSTLEELLFRYRTLTRHSRVLVVLDGVPEELDVSRLLPAGSKCGAILTGRRPVAGVELPSEQMCELSRLAQGDAVDLLRQETGRDEPMLLELADRCDGHPLALRLAGTALAQRPQWEPHPLSNALESIDHPDTHRPEPFDAFYAFLADKERLAFRCLAVMPDHQFVPWMLAAAADVDDDEARLLGGRLAHLRLIERYSPELFSEPRYVIDEAVGEYARRRANIEDSPVDRDSRRRRLRNAANQRRSQRADHPHVRRLVFPRLASGNLGEAWIGARAALSAARETGDLHAEASATVAIAEVSAEFGNLGEAEQLLRRSIEAASAIPPAGARTDDASAGAAALGPASGAVIDGESNGKGPVTTATLARAHRCLGQVLRRNQQWESAAQSLDAAVKLARRDGEPGELVRGLTERAVLASHRRQGGAAVADLQEAEALCTGAGKAQLSTVWWARGLCLLQEGKLDQAAQALTHARTHAERPDHALSLAQLFYWSAVTELGRENFQDARTQGTQGLIAFDDMRHRYGAGRCRHILGLAALHLDDPDEAVRLLQEAVETLQTCGDPNSLREAQLSLDRALGALDSRAQSASSEARVPRVAPLTGWGERLMRARH